MILLTALSTLLWSPAVLPDSNFLVVSEVRFVGNQRTKESILRRELDFREGDTLYLKDISQRMEANRRKIVNTNLFNSVESVIDVENSPKVTVIFTLKEQWYLIGYPVFSLADRNFNEWWYDRNRDLRRTIYGVHIRHANVRGRAEQLRLGLELGFARSIDISYKIPYLDARQKTGLTAGVSFTDTKNLSYRTEKDKLVFLRDEAVLRERFFAFVNFRRRNKFYDFQNLEFRFTQIAIADTIAQLNPNYFLDGRTRQRFASVVYSYVHDFRDRNQYPLRGHYFEFRVGRYGILPSDDLHLSDLSLTYARYRPLGRRWFWNTTAKGRTSYPNNQPFLQTRGLGYGNDLVRGFELTPIDGQHAVFLRNTLRFQAVKAQLPIPMFKKIPQFSVLPVEIYPTFLLDFGGVSNSFPERNNSLLANRLLVGYGVGLDIVSWYNTVFKCHYAFTNTNQGGFRFNVAREF